MNIKDLFKRKGMPAAIPVDSEKMTSDAKQLRDHLLRNIIGQDRAINQLVKAYESFQAGVNDPDKPLTNLLFLGPTGSGKTRIMEVFCEYFWKTKDAMIKIDCAEFQHSHEVSKLIGSPPGYVGYAAEARVSKERLEKYWKNGPSFSVILFDEVEKAHPDFHQLLLGVMDKGFLTLGKNEALDLRKCFVVMTSNLGAKTVKKHLTGREIGLTAAKVDEHEEVDQQIYQTSMAAVKTFFEPEFVNRLDRVIVFRALSEESIRAILEIELDRVQERLKSVQKWIVLACSKSAKDFLIAEGVNIEFGARELRRAIERFLVNKMSRIIATEQAVSGDMLQVDHKEGEGYLSFAVLKGVVDIPLEPQPKLQSKMDAPVEGFYTHDRSEKISRQGGKLVLVIAPRGPCMFCGGYLFHREDCPDILKRDPLDPQPMNPDTGEAS